MRLLVVSNMWPGRRKANFGVFVADRVAAYRSLGAEVAVAAIDDPRRGVLRGVWKYGRLELRARREGRRFRPDVVEGHFLVPTAAITASAARAAGAPYILYAHGTDIRPAPRLVRRAVSGAAELHTNSEDAAARLRRLYPDGPTVRVIPPGVDRERFRPAGVPEIGLVGFVGDLVTHKGVDVLLRALAGLPAGVRLLVAGDGPERSRLRTLAAELGIADRVEWHGAVSHEEVPTVLARAAVVAVPSRADALGQVAVEALSCGRPVVVSAVGGLAGVPGEDCGEAVAPDDPEALAEALRRWLARTGDAEVSAAARERSAAFDAATLATEALGRLEAVAAR